MLNKQIIWGGGVSNKYQGNVVLRIGSYPAEGLGGPYYGYGSDYTGSALIENGTDITINRMSDSSLMASTQKETRYCLLVRPSNLAYTATLSYTFNKKDIFYEYICSVYNYAYDKATDTYSYELCNSSDVGKNVEYYLYSEPISPTHTITVGTRVHGRIREYGYYQGVCGSLSPTTVQCNSGTKTIGQLECQTYYGDAGNGLGFANADSTTGTYDSVSVIKPFHWTYTYATTQGMSSGGLGGTGTPGASVLFSASDLNKQIDLIIMSEYLLQQKTDQVLRELGYA